MPVRLAVSCRGSCLQTHECGRYHVVGQELPQVSAKQCDTIKGGARDNVRDQSLLARYVLTHNYDGLLDIRMRGQRNRDLCGSTRKPRIFT